MTSAFGKKCESFLSTAIQTEQLAIVCEQTKILLLFGGNNVREILRSSNDLIEALLCEDVKNYAHTETFNR